VEVVVVFPPLNPLSFTLLTSLAGGGNGITCWRWGFHPLVGCAPSIDRRSAAALPPSKGTRRERSAGFDSRPAVRGSCYDIRAFE